MQNASLPTWVPTTFGILPVSSFLLDLDENRLAIAKKLGADEVFKVDCKDGKIMAEKITEKFGMVDRTIECTGAESSIHTGIYVRNLHFFESKCYNWNDIDLLVTFLAMEDMSVLRNILCMT